MSDHDLLAEQKVQLQILTQRTMALAVGRGMYSLSTMRPTITEAVQIPVLNLSGRALGNTTVHLDETTLPKGTVSLSL